MVGRDRNNKDTALCEFTSPFHGCAVRKCPLFSYQSCVTHNLLDYRWECEALRVQTAVCVLVLMEGLKGVSKVLLQ